MEENKTNALAYLTGGLGILFLLEVYLEYIP